jgi:hypothetical protein
MLSIQILASHTRIPPTRVLAWGSGLGGGTRRLVQGLQSEMQDPDDLLPDELMEQVIVNFEPTLRVARGGGGVVWAALWGGVWVWGGACQGGVHSKPWSALLVHRSQAYPLVSCTQSQALLSNLKSSII